MRHATSKTPRAKASARSNPPWGYKAIAIFSDGRTQVCTRDGGPKRTNFPTRWEAVAYAERWITVNEEHAKIQLYRYEEARRTGRRPTREQALTALNIKERQS